jgi:hypothetical protein
LDTLLAAIVENDPAKVRRLLKAYPALRASLIPEPRLYETDIVHWIYAGDTALHLAAAGHRASIVRLLLAAGADPNAANNHRCSGPLHYAADGQLNSPAWDAKRQVETIQALLDAGAAINAQDKNGAAPLHRAVRTRCAAAMKCLLMAGSDPTLKNNSGSTPFHLAVQDTGRGGSGTDKARAAQRQIIREFLSFGVSTRLKDGTGKSVAECARQRWISDLLASR